MKCDELKVYEDIDDYIGYDDTPPMMYAKSEVDAAIAELKDEIHRKEGVEKRWFEQCMEARSENVRLKRALWLARASMCRNYDIRSYFIDHIDSKIRFVEFAMLMQKAAATAEIKAKEFE